MLTKEENEKIWKERVAEYRASNQTQKQFCEENSVSVKHIFQRTVKQA